MMNTPICDFVEKYIKSSPCRLHMPAHKGVPLLGCEQSDITEISGADSLYQASGIIKQSEQNAQELFGCESFYSTEGSSHCIRAMLYLLKAYGVTRFIAARNSHSVFLTACGLLNIDPIWLYGEGESYLSCNFSLESLEALLKEGGEKTALYITSPDYLGNICDIAAVSRLCKQYGALLCVDCAHGAYLKFLCESAYPTDLGADICCSSAHKTLPVLTGGAYLHIANGAPSFFSENARNALSLFGSTSPSYLILQSLDQANAYIENKFISSLRAFIPQVNGLKAELLKNGFTLYGQEPLKLTLFTKPYGYYGAELAKKLEESRIFCELADKDCIVFMLSPLNPESLDLLKIALLAVEKRRPITEPAPTVTRGERVISLSEAVFSQSERVNTKKASGRVLAQASVSCPPAVPIAVCGERITENAVKCFEYYGINEISVVKQ